MVPPQVSPSARKPLQIALRGDRRRQDRRASTLDHEAEAAAAAAADGRGRRLTGPTPPSTRVLAGRRIVLGVTGGIAAYKAVEVCRRLVDAGAHVVAGDDQGAEHFIGAHHPVGARQRARPDAPLGRGEPDPAHPARPGRRPDPRRPGHGPPARRVRRRPRRPTCSPTPCSPPGRRWSSARRCTPRCGSTRRSRTTWPRCAAAACTSSSPTRGGSPAATSARAAWPRPSASSPRSSALLGPRRPRRSARRRHRRRHPRADRRRARHRQPRVGQAGLRDRRRGRGRGARRSRSCPPSTCRVPPGVDGRAGRDRRADAGGDRRAGAATADVVVMAAAVADFRPVAAAERQDQEGRRASRRSCSSRRRTSSPGSARAKRAGQVLVGFAAETDDLLANAESEAAAQAPRPDRRQRRQRPGRRLRARHQRGHPARAGGEPRDRAARRQTRDRRGPCSTASSTIRRACRDRTSDQPPSSRSTTVSHVAPSPPRP